MRCDASLTIFLSCKPLPLYEVGVFLYESCRKIMEIVLKYVGPLYNSAVHAMEPRCGEDPPYPCMPNPIPISQCPHIPHIRNTLTGSPKHIQEYFFIPKHIQRGSPMKTKWPPPPFPFHISVFPIFKKNSRWPQCLLQVEPWVMPLVNSTGL